MKTTIVILILLASHGIAAPVDTDGDGMPDHWEKQYGLNHTNAADAALDSDGDGFSNLYEYQNSTRPGRPTDCEPTYRVCVNRVEARGTNHWVHFLQVARKPVWVQEGKPTGPIGGLPDWGHRHFWKKVSWIEVDTAQSNAVRVLLTYHREEGNTNVWSVPFVHKHRRIVETTKERKRTKRSMATR